MAIGIMDSVRLVIKNIIGLALIVVDPFGQVLTKVTNPAIFEKSMNSITVGDESDMFAKVGRNQGEKQSIEDMVGISKSNLSEQAPLFTIQIIIRNTQSISSWLSNNAL